MFTQVLGPMHSVGPTALVALLPAIVLLVLPAVFRTTWMEAGSGRRADLHRIVLLPCGAPGDDALR
ncbi:MAG TPA: hypothetical protein VFZ27_13935 [Terriglobia bacterium]|nr:hypothetical protein [Terriglobia bacterium]